MNLKNNFHDTTGQKLKKRKIKYMKIVSLSKNIKNKIY